MTSIRPATAADAAPICALANAIIRNSTASFKSKQTTAAAQARLIRDRNPGIPAFLVACDGDAFLGFATFFPFRNGDGYRHTAEHTIILADAAKGRGVGAALMGQIGANARAAGMHSLIGGVSAENTAGLRFHQKIGFAEIARLPQVGRKFDRWLDLVLMQKML